MKNLAVFISGTGTNLKTIATFCMENPHLAKINVVISNKENVQGLQIASDFNIPSFVIKTKNLTMEEFERNANKHLDNIDLICLAGFMRVLTAKFTDKWKDKIINIHPSLLPAFKGANAINDALLYGVKVIGCTVHYVTADVDSGAIVSQKAIEVYDCDTKETIQTRIREIEYQAYKEALYQVCK